MYPLSQSLPRKCVQKKRLPKKVLRKLLKDEIKRLVFDFFDDLCAYCGEEAENLDHIIPKYRKGDDSPRNQVASCAFCNTWKGSDIYEKWYTEANHPDFHPIRAERIKEWRSR